MNDRTKPDPTWNEVDRHTSLEVGTSERISHMNAASEQHYIETAYHDCVMRIIAAYHHPFKN